MKFVVLGLVVACSSPHGSSVDASLGGDASSVIDASRDAPADGAVPMPPCSTTVDLDGDGLGWECDPVEHLSLTNTGTTYLWYRYLSRGTFAAHIGIHCTGFSGACPDHAAIEIAPDRAVIRRSDSGLLQDTWLHNATIGGPCIDADHTVWWSSSATAMTGTIGTT